jgi:NAD(P)-dependent dehydrogenase (short-subunit alcohol dehydrogenase family)
LSRTNKLSNSGPIHSGANFEKAISLGLADPVKFSAGTCLKRMGTTEEIGKVLAFLMSDDASYITGGMYLIHACNYCVCFITQLTSILADIPVDGGACAL